MLNENSYITHTVLYDMQKLLLLSDFLKLILYYSEPFSGNHQYSLEHNTE